MKKLIVIVLVLCTIWPCVSCANTNNDDSLEQTREPFPKEDWPEPIVAAWLYEFLPYEEFFSEERTFSYFENDNINNWGYIVHEGNLYKYYRHFDAEGNLIEPLLEEMEQLSDTGDYVMAFPMRNHWVYCISDTMELFQVDPFGEDRAAIAQLETMPVKIQLSMDIIYYVDDTNTIYRVYFGSGEIDKGITVDSDILVMWPTTNYSVLYYVKNPDYKEYVKQSGDDSGKNYYMEYSYNFQTNENTYLGLY